MGIRLHDDGKRGAVRGAAGAASVLAIALLTVGCAPAGPPPVAFQLDTQPWQFGSTPGKRLLTDHFDIRTTVRDERFLRLLPAFAETAHARFAAVCPAREPAKQPRMNVFLFGLRPEWDRFTRRFAPGRAGTYVRIRAGGYMERDTAVLYLTQPYDTFAVLAHEAMHMYLARHFGRTVPPWLSEGLATYMEGHHWRDDRPIFTPGRNVFRHNHLRAAVHTGTLIPLRELLGTNAGRELRGSSARVKTYYAEVWALTLFLRHGADGRYADKLTTLLADFGSDNMREAVKGMIAATPTPNGQPISFGEAVFRIYVSDDPDAFWNAFDRFVRSLCDYRRSDL